MICKSRIDPKHNIRTAHNSTYSLFPFITSQVKNNSHATKPSSFKITKKGLEPGVKRWALRVVREVKGKGTNEGQEDFFRYGRKQKS